MANQAATRDDERYSTLAAEPIGSTTAATAGRGPRIAAAIIDGVFLMVIDAVVLYLTLALVGLGFDSIRRLPWMPLAAFLLLLNGVYLVAFVGASGQTIGKMVAHLRVLGDDGRRVTLATATVRAVGCALSLATAGLGYLPAFFGTDGRALHDRLSGTRVVRAD